MAVKKLDYMECYFLSGFTNKISIKTKMQMNFWKRVRTCIHALEKLQRLKTVGKNSLHFFQFFIEFVELQLVFLVGLGKEQQLASQAIIFLFKLKKPRILIINIFQALSTQVRIRLYRQKFSCSYKTFCASTLIRSCCVFDRPHSTRIRNSILKR